MSLMALSYPGLGQQKVNDNRTQFCCCKMVLAVRIIHCLQSFSTRFHNQWHCRRPTSGLGNVIQIGAEAEWGEMGTV